MDWQVKPKPLSEYWLHVIVNLIGCPEPHAWLFFRIAVKHSFTLMQSLSYDPNEHSPFVKQARVLYSEIGPIIEYILGPEEP